MKTRVLQLIRVAALLAFFRFVVCNSFRSLCLFLRCRAVSVFLSASQPASYESSPRHSGARLEVAWGSSSSSTAAPSHCGTMQPRASLSAQPQPPRVRVTKARSSQIRVHLCVCVRVFLRQALAAQAQAIIFQYANVLVPQNGAADAVEARGTDDAVVNHIHIRIQLLRPSCAH